MAEKIKTFSSLHSNMKWYPPIHLHSLSLGFINILGKTYNSHQETSNRLINASQYIHWANPQIFLAFHQKLFQLISLNVFLLEHLRCSINCLPGILGLSPAQGSPLSREFASSSPSAPPLSCTYTCTLTNKNFF